MSHKEVHRTHRIGWLRAAVLGANDGIVSTASLIIGVAASGASRSAVLVAGMAGLVAGAMSMAAGEFVSVSSQADTESADIERERTELRDDPERELEELSLVYEARGLDAALARRVAEGLMAHDALGAHARDELGISDTMTSASGAGGPYIGGHVRSWGGAAAVGRCVGIGCSAGCRRCDHGACRARSPGRGWRRSRGCTGACCCRSCDVLGSAGDGGHGVDRNRVRRSGLTDRPVIR